MELIQFGCSERDKAANVRDIIPNRATQTNTCKVIFLGNREREMNVILSLKASHGPGSKKKLPWLTWLFPWLS
jgi:hypothetical protein